MRVLFVTYCFGAWNGQALIGVYKRGLRVALQLAERGHRVSFFCTGRSAYEDDLTRAAEQRLTFVDLPFAVEAGEAAEGVRRTFLSGIAELAPDLVVVGEAPLAGAMLEGAMCAAELGIPLVILDNAYDPFLVERFCEVYGPGAEGIVLTGPSSFHTLRPRPYLCQVPAYVELPGDGDARLAAELGLAGGAGGRREDRWEGPDGRRLVTVLAYDEKVEKIGLSLLERLADLDLAALFVARNPERCQERLAALPAAVRRRARVIPVPADAVFFAALRLASLAVCKYGYMQVSECLTLQTPAICVYYEGPRWLAMLPEEAQALTWMTELAEADDGTVAAARRFLALAPDEVRRIHRGDFGAAATTAGFLERLPRSPRPETWSETLALGFPEAAVRAALAACHGGEVELLRLRSLRLRDLPQGRLHGLLCGWRRGGETGFTRLWARAFHTAEALAADLAAAGERRVLFTSAGDCLLIEADLGQGLLPPL